ncbi:carbon starvation protein A [Bifidobacterium anseris]|uniref:Carbon starvation protein A n=2 Tax=Bifidobacterium TaxID=1678 RepID=A0A2A2EJK3_9BIFI|nr:MULTISPECIES: YbdD/YjiX family protein [Bifidobacterium]PAU69187.1 carbon starvation protein A [Bifidobacterium italicum]PLS28093.1 carbon starvation protein A [Bifidobacterium anseris]
MTGAPAAWAARLWRGVVWYLRELSGEARYDHYVERMRREHPDRTPLGEREFLRERERHEREHPNTSCCC